jgi:hypothetical protein
MIIARRIGRARENPFALSIIAPLAEPRIATLVALVVYLLRASISPDGFRYTNYAYFNYLADAFLNGQLNFRLPTVGTLDLVFFADKIYIYSPPFPAIVVMPLVALLGVTVSDVLYNVILAAFSIGALAKLLAILDERDIAPLSAERRAILLLSLAFGSVILILAPVGSVWFTAQLVGWNCVLLATIAALVRPDRSGYFLTGLALACALATRNGLIFNGIWLSRCW